MPYTLDGYGIFVQVEMKGVWKNSTLCIVPSLELHAYDL